MSSTFGFPYKLAIGLALMVVIDTVIQSVWKVAASELPEIPSWAVVPAVLQQPLFLLIGALMFCQLFNWLRVLGEADLSFAQPFTALSRVTVCLSGAFFLHEQITLPQFFGILLVCGGTWCISRTARKTKIQKAAAP
jgi:drug/metabolite transporter (DMT)-like permease